MKNLDIYKILIILISFAVFFFGIENACSRSTLLRGEAKGILQKALEREDTLIVVSAKKRDGFFGLYISESGRQTRKLPSLTDRNYITPRISHDILSS